MCIICKGNYDVNMTILNCDSCPKLTSIPDTRMVRMPLASSLTHLVYLNCFSCPLLKSIPNTRMVRMPLASSLTDLTYLFCRSCPLLTSIPNNNYNYINTSSCKWLNPDKDKISKLIKVQRMCKKYLQRRHEVIIRSLIDYLPREVILYCIL